MMNKQRVVLIEDEYLARDELKDILRRKHKDVEIVGEAETTQAGWDLIEKGDVDGVFLDINIQTESQRAGMDLAHAIQSLTQPPWIVVTTAYQDFAVEAFDADPVFYLLKPLDDAKVAKAMDRVRKRCPPKKIAIKHQVTDRFGERRLAVEFVDPRAEILYVCTIPSSEALKVHLLGCRDLRVAGPLRDWQDLLEPYCFEKIRRDCLVNLAFRGGLQPHPFRDDAVQLTLKGSCPDRLTVSRVNRKGG